jgi:hypothetical protein
MGETIEDSIDGEATPVEDKSPCTNGAAAREWIKTVGPFFIAALTLWFALGQRDQRLTNVELNQGITDTKVNGVIEDVMQLQEDMSGVNVKLDLVYTDVQWMRNNWER